jgi:putative FmdB family regulatory protein
MPLYEYECDVCGLRFEYRQHITDDPLEKCPDCGGTVHRLIQPVGIIFKGSGFYVTDNRSRTKDTRKWDEKKPSDSGKSESKSTSESSSEKGSTASESSKSTSGQD